MVNVPVMLKALMEDQESSTELEAGRLIERILDLSLKRVVPDGQPSADYTFDLRGRFRRRNWVFRRTRSIVRTPHLHPSL